MKKPISIALILLSAISAAAQKTNDAIAKQIKDLRAEKTITLSYDESSGASKIFARAENFADGESRAAGVEAMNFGMAFFYVGKTLAAPPDTINLTFMALTKKPRFAAAHNWVATLTGGPLDLGDARYATKKGENIEYLNFKISRTDLAMLAASTNVKFKLGTFDFTFTPAQMTMLKNLIAITETH